MPKIVHLSKLTCVAVLLRPGIVIANFGQEGDPATCPLLQARLAAWDAHHGVNLSAGVPVHIEGMTALRSDKKTTIDISGIWNPGTWQRGGRVGYERNSTAQEAKDFQAELGNNGHIYMSFNSDRGWWMVSPDPMCGTGTQGWAVIEAPTAEFPHQVGRRSTWRVITGSGMTERSMRVRAKPTAEFLLALSALVDQDGDEAIDVQEVAAFSFGGLAKASLEEGRTLVTIADANSDGVLTMSEVAAGHERLGDHKLMQRWLGSTPVVEATLRLLQREASRVRHAMPQNDATWSSATDEASSSCEVGQLDSNGACIPNASPDTRQEIRWRPFKEDSNCPLADTVNTVYDWGQAVLQIVTPKLLDFPMNSNKWWSQA